MPPIVLAVATNKHARRMRGEGGCKDILQYTKSKFTVGKDVLPMWPSDKLTVLAEHSSVFQDLFSDAKVQQIFSSTGPHAASMKLFRYLHFTSESSESSHKMVLRFAFKIPPSDQMDSLKGLMDLVPMFIDIVGTYKLPPDLKRRALDARQKQSEEDEAARKKRLEAVQQKKLDKAEEERVII